MKRREFEKRVKDENLKMEDYDIALDHYYDGHPHFMGCVKKWEMGDICNKSQRWPCLYHRFV